MKQEKVWDAVGVSWKNWRDNENPEVVRFLKGKRGKILDLGCGSGRNFVKKKGLDFYSIDFSEKMIRFAEAKNIAKEIKKSSVDDIPYSDEFFDFGIYAVVLHCVDNKDARWKSLKELFRVLKKGGEALVSVWSRKSPRLKNKEKECSIPWTVDGKKFFRYTYIYDSDELERLLKSVGFKIVRSWEEKNIWFVVRKC